MRRRTLIPIAIILSIGFNLGFVIFYSEGQIQWPFFDLGPAILQDSYFSRAPGLESVFGVIGDVPGGYSLYNGNPLQIGNWENLTGILDSSEYWTVSNTAFNLQALIIGMLFAVVPFLSVIILGRRSYGSAKTQ